METAQLLDLMGALGLAGMRASFEETLAQASSAGSPVHQILGTLLQAEAAERKLRSIRYQLGRAKLPVAKDLASFVFEERR